LGRAAGLRGLSCLGDFRRPEERMVK
jgi:hypothetical protein